jgi:hypothetical protein
MPATFQYEFDTAAYKGKVSLYVPLLKSARLIALRGVDVV